MIVLSNVAGSTCHPWLFIEETANKEVEKDFASVYSRLILCKTFRLDEDGKVLTPEEVNWLCINILPIYKLNFLKWNICSCFIDVCKL